MNERLKYDLLAKVLTPPFDLELYFKESKLNNEKIKVIDIGNLDIHSGYITACDPLVYYDVSTPFLVEVPKGSFKTSIAVWLSKDYGNRYLALKVAFSDKTPLRYEAALSSSDNIDTLQDDEFIGFDVDAGLAMVTDYKTLEDFREYWSNLEKSNPDIDIYDDLFSDLLEESAKKYPLYQRSGGDYVNCTNSNFKGNMIIAASGFGDGAYPCYFGYDADNNLTSFYILFIDIFNDLE